MTETGKSGQILTDRFWLKQLLTDWSQLKIVQLKRPVRFHYTGNKEILKDFRPNVPLGKFLFKNHYEWMRFVEKCFEIVIILFLMIKMLKLFIEKIERWNSFQLTFSRNIDEVSRFLWREKKSTQKWQAIFPALGKQ